ncbi:MAG: proton-conducting transporter membrane subunit [Pseudomonadota bacterium]
MPDLLTILPTLAPLALIIAGLLCFRNPGLRPKAALAASRGASLFGLAAALGTIGLLIAYGPIDGALIGSGWLSLGDRIDPLSTALFTLIAFIGVIVLQYSRNYLDGDAAQGRFLGWMCLTLAAVMLLVLSGTLFQLALAWIGTSLGLHKLLIFYNDRPAATIAARKRTVVARLSDAALISAFILIGMAFGETQISAILAAAKTAEPNSTITVAACLIALAALLKSAQFPTHGWLIEVMETPTPVSALLHAGIVNAGGFLVIRFADVMLLALPSLWILAFMGGLTALVGVAVMLTQSRIKNQLAWSTVAQMGLMLMQCGFGAFSLALLHIIAHSVYKAHSFLSSGSVIDAVRVPTTDGAVGRPDMARFLVGAAAALTFYVGIGSLMGIQLTEKPGWMVFGAVLVLALARFMAKSLAAKSWVASTIRIGASAVALSALYFALQLGAAWLVGDSLPATAITSPVLVAMMVGFTASFILLMAVQHLPPSLARTRFAESMRIHTTNGFYANAVFNRIVGASRGQNKAV